MADTKRVSVVFFRLGKSEPVREWLKEELGKDDRKKIGEDIKTVELSWPVGMPLVKPFGGGLFEVRTDVSNGTARVFFTVGSGHLVLLHAVMKKSQKAKKKDIDLAYERLSEFKEEEAREKKEKKEKEKKEKRKEKR